MGKWLEALGAIDKQAAEENTTRKIKNLNQNLAGTRLILSDAVLAELSQARRTYRLSQQETD